MLLTELEFSFVKLPRLNNRRERFLSPEEARLLLEELENVSLQLHDMVLLSLQTGMRAGEIFNLKWGHLDFIHDFIHIADPKGGQPRKAFMTPAVKEMLMNRGIGAPEELVFVARGEKQINGISKTFARTVDQLGFNEGISDARQRVSFHSLRHTFASWLALQATPILAIKELLGHRILAMTERYSHLIPDMKREAVAGIARMMEMKASDSPQGRVTGRRNMTVSVKRGPMES